VALQPPEAAWSPDGGEFLLAYDAVLTSADPPRAIRDFLATSYEGAATLMGWSSELTTFAEPIPVSADLAARRPT
jgi:hypothetical protein